MDYTPDECEFLLRDKTIVTGATWASAIAAEKTAFIDLSIRISDKPLKNSKEQYKNKKDSAFASRSSRPNRSSNPFDAGDRRNYNSGSSRPHRHGGHEPIDGIVINDLIKSIKVPDIYFNFEEGMPEDEPDRDTRGQHEISIIPNNPSGRDNPNGVQFGAHAIQQPAPLMKSSVLPILMWPTGPPETVSDVEGDKDEGKAEDRPNTQSTTREVRN